MEVDVDPLTWEAAGYDPLPASVLDASRQVADWLRNSQALGPDPVDTDVIRVGVADFPRNCSHKINQADQGSHLFTVSRAPHGGLVSEDADGRLLARRDAFGSDTHLFAESVKLVDQTLATLDQQQEG